ncbi:MAG: hypothetical protein ABFD58_01710 [Anaerolineaceae bacterium]
MKSKWIESLFLVFLFLIGILLWGMLLNWGNVAAIHDWAEINLPRVAFLQNAVRTFSFPLHMVGTGALRGLTDRFLSIPDVILSPDVILLSFLNINTFILIHWLICYTLGYLALVWLYKKHNLQLGLLFLLFILINFNGHIVSHISVGHLTWGGYFLFPWLIIFCLELNSVKRSWVWISAVSITMLMIWLLGSFQQYVFGLILLLLFCLLSWRKAGTVLISALFSILLSLGRILPSILIFGIADNAPLGGYPLLRFMWSSAVSSRTIDNWLPFMNFQSPLGWWEFNIYIGKLGMLVLVILGGLWVLQQFLEKRISAFWLPVLGLFYLSIRNNYENLLSWMPLFAGVRVYTRMIILPMLIISIIGLIAFEKLKEKLPKIGKTIASLIPWLLGGWFAYDLIHWAFQWDVEKVLQIFPIIEINLASQVVGNHSDPQYISTLIAGAICSLLSLVFLIVMCVRENKKFPHNAHV